MQQQQQTDTSQPLADVRVLDLSHRISGPFAGKLLADFGADVIKIERPGTGDIARGMPPFAGNEPHLEKSGLFLHLNTNKRGIVLDLKTPQGVDIVKKLVEKTDILLESFRPGVMADLGLDYDTLSAINPGLIMTSISNFGQNGPYRDYRGSELVLYGMGGNMVRSGEQDRSPLKLGANHVQYQAGNIAAMSSLFAWYGTQYAEIEGQFIDIAIFQTQMASYNARMPMLIQYQYNKQRYPRSNMGGAGGGYPAGFYPCLDGYINITGGGAFWPRTCAVLGRPDLVNDPRFAPPAGQLSPEGREEFEAEIWIPWLLERTKMEVLVECQKHEMLVGAVNTIDEVVDGNPQFDARGYWRELEHPQAGSFRYPGSPIHVDEPWWQLHRPAPLLGQHTAQVLESELGYDATAIATLRTQGVI